MKINPIGINSYQQTTGQEAARRQATSGSGDTTRTDSAKVVIPPQAETDSSRVSVKISRGNYAEYLSTEERQALDLLFSRFADRSRFEPGYSRDLALAEDDSHLGKTVDVKV